MDKIRKRWIAWKRQRAADQVVRIGEEMRQIERRFYGDYIFDLHYHALEKKREQLLTYIRTSA